VRSRNLKPGFFKNEGLADLPPLTRILFAGLWGLADRAGRLEDRPKRIKAEVLPYDNCDTDKMLDALAQHEERFIIRYTVDGRRYIAIPKFLKNQSPHCREPESTIPAPDMHQTSTVREPVEHPLARGVSNGESGVRSQESVPTLAFADFWTIYPKKQDKGHAEKAWKTACKEAAPDEIIAGLQAQLDELKTRETKFIPLAATWLNGKRWADETPKTGCAAVDEYWGAMTDED
jgi:hypothetical protein